MLTITYHGHACFSVTCSGFTVVLDPYQSGSVPGLPELDLEADRVLCSHEHHDHNGRDCVRLRTGGIGPFRITEIRSFHDDCGGAKRGTNVIRVLEAEGLRVAHFGDLGCALTAEQAGLLKNLDAALIPVGGFYTIGPAQAQALIETVKPRVVIPMHYKRGSSGLPVIAELDDFLRLRTDTVEYPANTMNLTAETAPQTAVLRLP